MLNRFNVSSCTLNLYVGNPTLMETMLCQSVLGLPFGVTTPLPLYSILCTMLLAKSFENAITIHANKVGSPCRIHVCSVDPYLQYVQYCCTVWNPSLKRDIEAVEKLQQRAA